MNQKTTIVFLECRLFPTYKDRVRWCFDEVSLLAVIRNNNPDFYDRLIQLLSETKAEISSATQPCS